MKDLFIFNHYYYIWKKYENIYGNRIPSNFVARTYYLMISTNNQFECKDVHFIEKKNMEPVRISSLINPLIPVSPKLKHQHLEVLLICSIKTYNNKLQEKARILNFSITFLVWMEYLPRTIVDTNFSNQVRSHGQQSLTTKVFNTTTCQGWISTQDHLLTLSILSKGSRVFLSTFES